MNVRTATLVPARYGHECSLCGWHVQGRVADTPEQRLAEHCERVHFIPEVGMFLAETLVTDSIVWEVTHVTKGGSIVVRSTTDGEVLKRENRDGNPWPVVYTEAKRDLAGMVQSLRLRKNGTYRRGNGSHTLRPAPELDGKPFRVTDYRF